MLENIPKDEALQIQHIVDLTLEQLKRRYTNKGQKVLRGVHAKGHACASATFTVLPDIAANLRHGVFAQPGKEYSAKIRFSNADPLVKDDSPEPKPGAPRVHGSRGMAIKVIGVDGDLLPGDNPDRAQDFLMINQPKFAFANVEDYEILSQALIDHNENGAAFFAIRGVAGPPPASPTPAQARALASLAIVMNIQATSPTATAAPFQTPPASPVDNNYFGAAPFLLGPDQVMRFRAVCVSRSNDSPDINDANYLRNALAKRLKDKTAGDVVFRFEVQVRDASTISPDNDIENASGEWPDNFVHVATLTIPLQEVDTPELQDRCERLTFTPWRGLEAHKPLGGINRLRRTVYEASVKARLAP